MLRRLLALLWLLLLPVLPADAAMDYAKQVLIGADFSSRDLRGVTFNLTNLREADLIGFRSACRQPVRRQASRRQSLGQRSAGSHARFSGFQRH